MAKRPYIPGAPPNLPRDIKERDKPLKYDPRFGTMGAPRSDIGGKPEQLSQIVFPPWIFPPWGQGRYFFQQAQQTVGPGPVTDVELTGTVFTLPANNVGVVRSITIDVNALLATSDISFKLLFNGSPVQGHDNLQLFARAAASVTVSFSPEETVIPVPDGARISIAVTVTDAVAYDLGASFRGWFYSKTVADRYHTT